MGPSSASEVTTPVRLVSPGYTRPVDEDLHSGTMVNFRSHRLGPGSTGRQIPDPGEGWWTFRPGHETTVYVELNLRDDGKRSTPGDPFSVVERLESKGKTFYPHFATCEVT